MVDNYNLVAYIVTWKETVYCNSTIDDVTHAISRHICPSIHGLSIFHPTWKADGEEEYCKCGLFRRMQ